MEKKRDGYRRIPIKETIFNKAQEYYTKSKSEYAFSRWISEQLLMNLEKYEFLRIYAPYISLVGIHDNELFLKDEKEDRIIEVVLQDYRLYCRYCEKDDCMHVHYTLALPELGKLIQFLKNKK